MTGEADKAQGGGGKVKKWEKRRKNEEKRQGEVSVGGKET